MTTLSQRDPKWADITLGTGKGTIGYYGCTITCLAMIMGLTPDVVNEKMKSLPVVNGNTGFANGNLVLWSRLGEAFPDFEFTRVWSYDNSDVLNNVPVLVEVPATAIGGTSKHWVVFIGNHQLNDPWAGSTRPTNDFLQYGDASGYCIVKKKVVVPPPLEGLSIQVGYNPTFQGQDVTVNGVHYISVDGKTWESVPVVELPVVVQTDPGPSTTTSTTEHYSTTPTIPHNGHGGPIIHSKTFLQLLADFIKKLLGG